MAGSSKKRILSWLHFSICFILAVVAFAAPIIGLSGPEPARGRALYVFSPHLRRWFDHAIGVWE